MATFTSYDSVGAAEDVQDLSVDISPTDCPMYTMIKPQKVHARVYEYRDSLAAAADNKAVEGRPIDGNTVCYNNAYRQHANHD